MFEKLPKWKDTNKSQYIKYLKSNIARYERRQVLSDYENMKLEIYRKELNSILD